MDVRALFGLRPTPTGRVIVMAEHRGWGNTIDWLDYPTRELYGCLPLKPVVGDVVECQMRSGRTARFLILKTRYPGDPHDMFFATTDAGTAVVTP